jgi:O-methyltransferase
MRGRSSCGSISWPTIPSPSSISGSDHVADLIAQAGEMLASRRETDAISPLQAAVLALEGCGASDLRRAATEMLLQVLWAQQRHGRLTKILRRYLAECAELPDARFDHVYVEGMLATRTSPVPLPRRDRFLRLTRELEKTLHLDGGVAECGCFRGLSSYLLCSTLKWRDPAFAGRGYRIFDSFEGLSPPGAEDVPNAADTRAPQAADIAAGRFAASVAQVKSALAAFPAIEYFPGWIPRAFPQDGARYRFVHVDVDLYQPTRASLEYFWPRLAAGAILVCDDYNWAGARRAVDEFSAANGLAVEETASRQAVLRKAA